jgi:integrase
MATIKFLLQSQSEQSNIYVRLSIDRNNVFKRKTGFIINSKDWSNKKGQPILNDEVLKNQKVDLDEFKTKLENAHNNTVKQGLIINAQWLEEQIDLINNKKPIVRLDILTNYTQHFIDNAHKRKNQTGGLGLKPNRIKSIVTFLGLINDFQKHINKEILIRNINPSLANDFKNWLFSKGFSINYVGKNINNLKTLCRDADKNNIEIHPKLKFIETVSESTPSENLITLSFDELDKINNTKLMHTALINARKWLILGCYIGQRGADLLNLTTDNIKAIQDVKIIELEQQKTGKKVVIPILPEAEEVINSGLPYKISLQKFNDHLKTICEIAGLDQPTKGKIRQEKTNLSKLGIYPKHKLISSHVCRRSFASNYYGLIPTPVLIGITKHSSETMFLKYIGKTSYDNAYQMLEYVNKLQPRKPQPQMKVVKKAN